MFNRLYIDRSSHFKLSSWSLSWISVGVGRVLSIVWIINDKIWKAHVSSVSPSSFSFFALRNGLHWKHRISKYFGLGWPRLPLLLITLNENKHVAAKGRTPLSLLLKVITSRERSQFPVYISLCCFSALKDLNLGNNKCHELPKGKSEK